VDLTEATAHPAGSPADNFRIALPNFEGPLDLLLHLIREHKLDIFNIPIALVTQKYVEHLELMREVNLDIAGEFLVMASTLAHIKSRLLLPRQEAASEEEQEEQGDPRAELVRRLLEYQKYKDAAGFFARRPLLDRDVFPRRVTVDRVPPAEDELGLAEVSIFRLIEALDRVLKNAAPELQHEIIFERVTISEAINEIADRLRAGGAINFFGLFEGQRTRRRIIVTFLALLEMCRLKLVRIVQDEAGDIAVRGRGDALTSVAAEEVKDDYK
jgi:segregation and condensation protein A